jgi:hypothetical protein
MAVLLQPLDLGTGVTVYDIAPCVALYAPWLDDDEVPFPDPQSSFGAWDAGEPELSVGTHDLHLLVPEALLDYADKLIIIGDTGPLDIRIGILGLTHVESNAPNV